MNQPAEAILEALRVVQKLLAMDSLSPPDHRGEPAWIEEVERRARRALSGEEPGVEVDEAIDDISRDLGL